MWREKIGDVFFKILNIFRRRPKKMSASETAELLQRAKMARPGRAFRRAIRRGPQMVGFLTASSITRGSTLSKVCAAVARDQIAHGQTREAKRRDAILASLGRTE